MLEAEPVRQVVEPQSHRIVEVLFELNAANFHHAVSPTL
jgi:hypothetical protein